MPLLPEHSDAFNRLQNRYLNTESGVQADMANALDTIINSVFSDPEMIGYELLQNADDANATEIEFVFSGNYLIIRHNGDPFTEQNLAAICRYGSRGEDAAEDEKEKANDIEKIGYKGIGFKSVFKVSHQVWVYSEQGYSFKFDRAYWGDKKLPWQIMPIPIGKADLPNDIQAEIKPDRINFVLPLLPDVKRGAFDRGRETIEFKISSLFEKAQIILFLRHISGMTLERGDEKRTITRSTEQNIHTIKDIRGDTFRWVTKQFRIAIPEVIKQQLAALPDTALPPKLKNALFIDLGFAAEYGSRNELIAQPTGRGSGTKLFTYLPTDKRYEGLPFFVNSSFLLNADRTELLPRNEWNKFILEQIGYYQFEWFKELAQEAHFRLSVTDLIVKYADSSTDFYNKAINGGVKKAQNQVPFIAVIEDSSLKKISETVVDKTGLGEYTGEYDMIKESFRAEEPETLYLADPKLKSIQKIVDAGAHNFDRAKLSLALRLKNKFTSPTDNLKLIQFFFQKITTLKGGPEVHEWNKVLNETPFLLTDTNTLREPPCLYFPEEKPSLPMEISMELLHTEVYENGVKEDPALKNWLQGIGVAPTTPLAIIRRGILPMIVAEKIPYEHIISVTRFIFQHQNALGETEFSQLSKKMPVLVQRQNSTPQVIFAEQCYLSDRYEPILPIEQYLPESIFVCYDYVERKEDLGEWKRFWKRLKVREEIGFDFDEGTFNLNNANVFESAKPYWEWLRVNGYIPDFSPTGAKNLLTNLNQKYLEYTTNYDFAVQFWTMLINHQWPELKRLNSRAYFQHTHGKTPIPSYFVWRVRTQSCFPATDRKCYRTEEVFLKALAPLVKEWQPIAELELTKNQAEVLGIKTLLSREDCIALLQHIADKKENDRERLTALYQYMQQNEYFPGEDVAAISWMAMDGSFHLKEELAYFDAPQFAQKSNSSSFVFMELKPEDARIFCSNWGIKVVGVDDFQINPSSQKQSDFLEELKEKLPYLASVTAHYYNISLIEEAKEKLSHSLSQYQFESAQSLNIFIELNGEKIYQKDVQAWKKDNTLYHLINWNAPLVRYALVELLAQILEWPAKAQTLDLLLQLEQNEMNDWLEENGYGTIIIDEQEDPPTDPEEGVKPEYQENTDKKPDTKIILENEVGPIVPPSPDNGPNESAHTLAQDYLENNGYALVQTDNEAAPGIIRASKDGVKKAFIVLSAKSGTLYLGQSNWLRLGWDNVELLVLTGDNSSDFVHFRSQKELLEKENNDYTIMVKKNTQNPEVVTALTEVLKKEGDFARFYFKVKQKSTVFESIKGFEEPSSEENAIIDEKDLFSW